MNQHLQAILNLIEESQHLSEEQKAALLKSAKNADKDLEITTFKLDRTEKVKRTTAILLEETIEELEQKRKAVETQNRELEIEASLERVRSIALSMKEPADMPEVCRVIATELDKLGLKEIRNVQTAIFYESKGTYMNYEYYSKHDKKVITETSYTNSEMHRAFADQMLKGKGEFFSTFISKADLPGWITYQKTTNVFIDTYLETAPSLSYYWFSLGPVALGISTYIVLSEEAINLFKRFLKVFELAYTRYLDIEQAIAQLREAKIEAALERVRSRSLAMHKSDELEEVIRVVSEQLQQLQFSFHNVSFAFNNEQMGLDFWLASPADPHPLFIKVPYLDNPSLTRTLQARAKGDNFFADVLTTDENHEWIQHVIHHSPLKDVSEENINFLLNTKGYARSTFLMKHIILAIGNYFLVPYTNEQNAVLKRFGNVFEQSYTRFLDLQKAEAQAREAQIEAALEKVRSRSLSMYETNELNEVVTVVFEKLQELGIALDAGGAIINIFIENSRDVIQWIASPDLLSSQAYYIPYFDHPIFHDLWNARESGLDFFSRAYSYEEKNSMFKKFFEFTDYKRFPDDFKEWILQNENYSISGAWSKHSSILIPSHNGALPSEEQKEILRRFAKVFEQAYTRFLDLQKAEAQAREAQIEAGLEKVRSRSLAMHKSDELQDVVNAMFERLKTLKIEMNVASIFIFKEGSKDWQQWVASVDTNYSTYFHLPYTDNVIFNDLEEAKQKEKDFYSVTYSYEQKNDWFDYAFLNTEYSRIPDDRKKFLIESPFYHVAFALTKHTGLQLCKYSGVEFSEIEHGIMKRFAKVFEQAYTRFLDLQKAEAQARESQIQLALERVRARTMAMYQSTELADTASVLFQQIKDLGFETWSCGFCTWQKDDIAEVWMGADSGGLLPPMTIPYKKEPTHHDIFKASLQGETVHQKVWKGKALEKHYAFLRTIPSVAKAIEQLEDAGLSLPTIQCYNVGFFKQGYLLLITKETNVELYDLTKRFTKVFEQTYTRFLDLQTAEAQAREAQIEAALEKVRSRSMGMQKSEELKEVIKIVYQQLKHLKINLDHAGFVVDYVPGSDWHFWIADEQEIPSKITHPYFESVWANQFNETKEKGADFFTTKLNFEEKNKFYNELLSYIPGLSEASKDFYLSCPGLAASTVLFDNVSLYIENFAGTPYTGEENNTLMRFGKVFQQTYTRFLDLQRAEEQTREAQIEASLERVRSKAMAMQKSEDLANAVAIVFEQLDKLDLGMLRCGIGIINKDNRSVNVWAATKSDKDMPIQVSGDESMDIHPLLQGAFNAWLKQEEYSYVLQGEDLTDYYKTQVSANFKLPESHSLVTANEDVQQYYFLATFPAGGLFAFRETAFSEEAKVVMKRFADVFNLTYTRYHDLQKAEAQAREAQIELSLERVRAKTMAMHNSEDVADTVATMFDELVKLGIETLRCGIGIMHEPVQMEVWTAKPGAKGKADLVVGRLNMTLHSLLEGGYRGWKSKKEYYGYELKDDDLINYFTAINNYTDYPVTYDLASLPNRIFHNEFYFPEGTLYVFSLEQLSPDAFQVFKRFASVFGQTYRRYLDLVNAEAQTRQAKIEGAMEKVRARAMAMQKPDELIEVAEVLRKEMGLLGVEELETSSIYIHNETTGKTECWYAIQDQQEKKLVSDHMNINLSDTSVGRHMLEFYRSGEKKISIVMQGAERKEWINYCAEHSKVLVGFYGDDIPNRIYHLYKFSNGYMGAASPGDISAESWDLLQRATSVFSLAYTRFSDLQLAEASAKEAVKQAALDRVRAEIASMRTIADLDRITPLIWNELNIIGVPFIRCGVFIMDDTAALIHTFLSTPEGEAIAAFHLPYTTQGNMAHVLSNWQKKKNYIDHWDESAFTEFASTLVNDGAVGSPEQYLKTIPSGGFYLHFLPFLQGMLYVGNTTKLDGDQIKLIQSVADAFSTAYARYEDFNKLEAAKQQVDETLVDLKQAQAQLVQSEKMASLGELTAGIAHEIQNPLNFVNNFSEVSNELILELKSEKAKIKSDRDEQLEEDILNDISSNLEKILHHGKRADGIVKGMLQHSRTSKAMKEAVNINKLADEYLRLAYHGLRAKDNFFNATLKTNYDENIEDIIIIPQDIARVVLNLYNNAFYAVDERLRQAQPGSHYKPTVSVSTKKINNKVEIRVEDNGKGIPQNIVDKIFQPFFTTKPTGQGTGLGLSLSYDIIKAHGGEIKVGTREGEGSTFIIQLPLT